MRWVLANNNNNKQTTVSTNRVKVSSKYFSIFSITNLISFKYTNIFQLINPNSQTNYVFFSLANNQTIIGANTLE